MDSGTHRNGGGTLRKLYIEVGSQDNYMWIDSQYLIDYILYDQSPSSIGKIFQYSSC